MSLVTRLETDHQAARSAALRGGDKTRSLLLGTLLGDLVTEARKKVNRAPTDAEAEAKVLLFLAGARTNLAASAGRPDRVAKFEEEIAILTPYAPKVPAEAEVAGAIAAFRAGRPDAKIGDVMAHLAGLFGAGLDRRRASELARAA
jgi:uncharacterized protein YqeY